MKQNVTIALERDLVTRARKIAADEETTLNGLLRQLLEEKVRLKTERRKAIREMIEQSRATKARIDMSSVSREATYADRADRIGR